MEAPSKCLTFSNTQLSRTSVVLATSGLWVCVTCLPWASWNNFQVVHLGQYMNHKLEQSIWIWCAFSCTTRSYSPPVFWYPFVWFRKAYDENHRGVV